MPTLNLNQDQVVALRRYLTQRDDWGISPAEYSTAIAEVLAMLGDSPEDTCRWCGKPRREHAFGYSADRCVFSA